MAEEEHDRVWLFLAIIVVVIIIIGLVIFVGVDFKAIEREISGGQVCTITADCGIGEYCSADDTCISTQACDVDVDCFYGQSCSQFSSNTKRCVAASCKQNSDCPQGPGSGTASIRCIKGLCTPKACMLANDCETDEACLADFCTPVGETCATSSDCFRSQLMCVAGKCVECTKTSDCTDGQFCDITEEGGICKSGCTTNTQCGTGMTCVTGNCCPSGTDTSCGMACTETPQCSGDCKHCVNGVCTCIPGAEPSGDTRFQCTSNTDCASGNCLIDTFMMGTETQTCGWKAVECLYDNGAAGKASTCPNTTAPFCIEGVCQASAAGAICGIDELEMCPKGLDCVNQICGVDRGVYGDVCQITSDCESGLNCTDNTCIPAT
uniref:Transmembrane protein n=1 Tax=Pithovirus LCPAC103 TaxID=2506588 RepID=A0A481Z3F8_9VIRU|nr:MAG: transmembrane protein [Pithovirus LCPAC103]